MAGSLGGASRVRSGHLTATVRECWVLAANLRRSATTPNWTAEPTIHAVVIETVEVEPEFRRQGEFRAFLAHVCADPRFDLVIVEGVLNVQLAHALTRWGWECDRVVMDFYRKRTS